MEKHLSNRLMSLAGFALFIILSSNLMAQPTIPDITGVKSVEFNLACEVTLLQGDKASMVITGDSDELEDVKVRINGSSLEVYNKSHYQHKHDVLIKITVPDLKKLTLSGVVDIKTPEMVQFSDLELEVSGVAEFDLLLKSSRLEIEASGVVTGDIAGETKNLEIEISGVGKLDASEFKSENCEVEVSGVAKASVYATEKLDASVSGMGRINYAGRPIINKSSSGFGSISRL